MVSLFLLLGCNLSYIVDLFAGLHELALASTRTLLKLASSVRALLKPYGDTLNVQNVKQKSSFFHKLIVPWFTMGDISVTYIFAIELSLSVKRRMDRE